MNGMDTSVALISKELREAINGTLVKGDRFITVEEFLEDSVKLRCLPEAILFGFQPEEFPRLADILARALKTLDPYRVEIPTLVEKLREIGTFQARRFAVFVRRCPA